MHLDAHDPRLKSAAWYHTNEFPPGNLELERLMNPVTQCAAAVSRFDARLELLHNKDLLLAPMRGREAVISSRMEGTVATLDEVLSLDADELTETGDLRLDGSRRDEVMEVLSYKFALNHAQQQIEDGIPLSRRLLEATHRRLLLGRRGGEKQPGEFKRDQNYIADQRTGEILFVPIDPISLADGFTKLEKYINDPNISPLICAAISHIEFEALHPFKDGNGRIGRMLTTLQLWTSGLISAPHFYISEYLEKNKEEYITRMRRVSSENEWTEWCIFFLGALEKQASMNLQIAADIEQLYGSMKERFRKTLNSQWTINALDAIFARPVFRNAQFIARSKIPKQSGIRFTRALVDAGLLRVIQQSSGRRPALFAFEPLLEIVRR